VLPAGDRDLIQRLYVEAREARAIYGYERVAQKALFAASLISGGLFLLWIMRAPAAFELTLGGLLMGAGAFGVMAWQARERAKRSLSREMNAESALWKLGLYVTREGIHRRGGDVLDPLVSASYDLALPRLEPREK
jgi:hypothetical protein